MDCGDCEHFYYRCSRGNTEIISWFKFYYEKNEIKIQFLLCFSFTLKYPLKVHCLDRDSVLRLLYVAGSNIVITPPSGILTVSYCLHTTVVR